jgi:hypothetical protein
MINNFFDKFGNYSLLDFFKNKFLKIEFKKKDGLIFLKFRFNNLSCQRAKKYHSEYTI